ncbi:hypothetical protein [Microbulbifer hydrolyticus]|uniref:Outer membrane beta-barrel protein n=1 Tax=Microbulbifer hydrolyticus TaxID=48074 RepID=A0A6P1THE9_9GAMM|nr:hypothetical protein [Microbulbifer hydrolyticus]MBB5212651.1 hypothetical protein [Microbulbifer hydrolyticus]QHQ40252.1 hypothetical protein GTQ55_15550 [Microbulbifer hydrolyticus]
MDLRRVFALAALLPGLPTLADTNLVDRVFDPYVEYGETEVEWRAVRTADSDDEELDGLWQHHFSVGYGFSERWFGEIYVIAEQTPEESFDIEAAELEAKWQLTEKGEYAADWGMLFELERIFPENQWEAAATVLVAQEWGRWTGTANLGVVYEWGEERDGFLGELRAQARYRYSTEFEPAIELYAAEDLLGIGPVAIGSWHLGGEGDSERKVHWEVGLIMGITDESPDQTLRLRFEYAFF